jgi:dTDP-4-amino-4,6-dideoxygalactose transaminase
MCLSNRLTPPSCCSVVKYQLLDLQPGSTLKKFFPVSQPSIGERELEYVADAVKSGWVSSIGKYVEQFETMFATFCGTRYALAVSNGTTGLHLALVSAGIKSGDEVIIPDLTFIATANAVTYTGAAVVPVDIDSRTLCMDPESVERAITSRTRAIIPVHLYGHAAQMDRLMAISREREVLVLEDAAEAHGAEFNGLRVGSFGDCGIFSFYGNKVITSGEGGMLTTNDHDLYVKAKLLRDHEFTGGARSRTAGADRRVSCKTKAGDGLVSTWSRASRKLEAELPRARDKERILDGLPRSGGNHRD